MTEIEFYKKAMTCPATRERFLLHKQRLVKAVCYRYCGKYDDDMLQEGNIGLMLAFDKFDPDLGYKFDTYAKQWVFSYMQQYNWKKHLVRIGKRVRYQRMKEGGETVIPVLSLNWHNEDGEVLIELPSDDPPVWDILQKKFDIRFVQQSVKAIKSDRNRDMVIAYYGLGNEDPINMTILSDIHKVSKQRCQQIISAEVEKIGVAYSHIDSW